MCILELALAAQMRMSFGKRKSFFFQMDQAYAPFMPIPFSFRVRYKTVGK